MVSFKFLGIALAANIPVLNALSIHEKDAATREFRRKLSPGAKIYFPSDPNYTNLTAQRWTVYEEPTYSATIIPAVESDVQNIVKIAGRYGIPFLATGGGHGLSTTLSKLQDGINIDLNLFKKVDIDLKASTVTVGGANVFGDVFKSVWDAGKEMVTGSCACPGIVGATIGGGVGRLQGVHGLIIDTLVEAVVVTADGSLVTASEKKNSDLFWALRGAGGSYGIILWATYRLFDQTNGGMAFNADFVFPVNQSVNHWQTLKEAAKNLPAEMALISAVNYNDAYGGANILFNAVFYGPEAIGRKFIEPFYKNQPLISNVSYVHASELLAVAVFGLFNDKQCAKGRHVNTYTVGQRDVEVATWDSHTRKMTELWTKYPQTRRSNAFLETFPNQAVLAADPHGTKTAFPKTHREITNYVLWGYNYDDDSIDDEVNDFARTARTAFTETSGFKEMNLYVTYAHGDEGPKIWYKEKLARLKQIKRKYDPKQLFRFMNPVPLH
ncbi:hypothetical protein V8F06_010787 [Rhypophila decipiens]